jgi:hypothetical protein
MEDVPVLEQQLAHEHFGRIVSADYIDCGQVSATSSMCRPACRIPKASMICVISLNRAMNPTQNRIR